MNFGNIKRTELIEKWVLPGTLEEWQSQAVELMSSPENVRAVDSVAKTYLSGNEVTEGLLNRVEAAVRAHDPCLSCSTHAMGQMPIIIEIKDPQENIIQTLQRD